MASDLDPVAELLVPGLPRLLDNIAQAVIVQDESGRIQLLNVAARRLFPDLNLGDDFKRSGESFVFVAEPGGRRVSGRLRRLADGWRAWVVSDQDFMLEASRELSAGEGADAAAALVQLAVPVLG
ncbi:MAG: hypothetical protein WBR33_13010, partial [Pseudonocardiaceae bacterium]